MRDISASVRAKLFASESSGVLPALLEITHDVARYESPLRIANNTVDLEFGGHVFYAFPFKYDPPDQKEDGSVANAKLTVCAVDQQLAGILRSTEKAPTIRAIATFWDDHGTAVFEELASWEFTVRNISGNFETITADLIYDDRLSSSVPGRIFRPAHFPGAF